VPVDMVGGASVGACIGFLLARGLDADAMQDNLRRHWSKLTDFTLPMASLIAGRRINDLIQGQCGEWDFEDLWLPFFSIATDLTTAHSVVHRRGNGAFAIRASTSLPGVMPPVPDGEHLLVDGGVMNNLPIDVTREHNPFGTVIAIDVVSPKGPVAKMDYGPSLSGWRLAFDKVIPWRRKMQVPSLATTIMRAMVIGAGRARDDMVAANLADFYHNIHVRGVGMLQFDIVDKTVDIGYNDTIGPLKRWIEGEGLG
jgi:lysophospholipid hydrolase